MSAAPTHGARPSPAHRCPVCGVGPSADCLLTIPRGLTPRLELLRAACAGLDAPAEQGLVGVVTLTRLDVARELRRVLASAGPDALSAVLALVDELERPAVEPWICLAGGVDTGAEVAT